MGRHCCCCSSDDKSRSSKEEKPLLQPGNSFVNVIYEVKSTAYAQPQGEKNPSTPLENGQGRVKTRAKLVAAKKERRLRE